MTEDKLQTAHRDGTEDLSYFRRLEEMFIALRGAPLLLSPADWEIARAWRRDEIPFDLIEGVLREVFERAPEKRGRGGVRSLKYFDSAVRRMWEEAQELGLSAITRDAVALDIDGRLTVLATSLPAHPPVLQEIKTRLLDLRGSAEEVESALGLLDEEMIRLARTALGPSEREQIHEEVGAALARLSSRVDQDESSHIRKQLEIRQVRRLMDLPVLSLFSPAAVPATN